MHWLQTLDTGLFYFINHLLSNPLFDRLMPLLSGGDGVMGVFVPAVVLAALAAIFFGNNRARVFALMMILIVIVGDSLIVNTIKHAVARPRPCITLPDDIERLGCTNSGSMPSAHAANWFAAAMATFLFYRKKKWLVRGTFSMASAVAFSRVYNGVHYPGDVLAGAILGMGYAAAIIFGLQFIWGFVGAKWFPIWHERMPLLLNPPEKSEAHDSFGTEIRLKSEFQWLRFGYVLIAVMFVGRLAYLASHTIELSQDEAYQWTWSKHLALSYYSKPLGIALIQFAGTHLFGDTALGVRFFSPVFAAILSFMLLRFLADEIGARASFCLLLAATATPLLGLGTILMTVDPPLVVCWTWAMIAGWRAMREDAKIYHWLIVGVAMGLGFLCKYSAVYQIVCFGIFFALLPSARIHLGKPGPWAALLAFALCTSPVFIWNAQHGWITATHVAGNAGLQSQWHPTLRYFRDYLFNEFALLNPFFFIGAVWAAVVVWKFRRERPLWLYFFCMGVPVFLGHLLWSLHSRILPNWIAPAILPMFCLMVAFWDEKFRNGARWIKPVFTGGIALGLCALAVMYQSSLITKITGRQWPGEKDPQRRARAWTQEAAIVEDAREKFETESGEPVFIICSHYGITGLYSFYNPLGRQGAKDFHPLIYSADSDTPNNQFYFWPEYNYRASRKGWNAIYVSEAGLYQLDRDWLYKWWLDDPLTRTTPRPATIPPNIAAEFQSVKDLGDCDVKIGNRVFHRIHLWTCYNLK